MLEIHCFLFLVFLASYLIYIFQFQEEMKKQCFKDNYEIIRKVGSGLTSEVYQAKSKTHGRVSIKIVSPSFNNSQIGHKLIQNQVRILATLNHKNVLKLIEKAQVNSKVHIVTNYCDGGDLQNYVRKLKKLSQQETLHLSKSIIQGLIYLKQKQIVHRDLKLSNIFLKDSEPIIADFGFAVNLTDKNLMNINAGSPLYMPIESLVNKRFSEKSDVFALGVCIFQMLTGRTPWAAKSESQLIQKLKNPPKIPSEINQKLGKIILRCLKAEPSQRPNLQQVSRSIQELYTKARILPATKQKQAQQKPEKEQKRAIKSISLNESIKKVKNTVKQVVIGKQKQVGVVKQKQNRIECNKKIRSITIKQKKNNINFDVQKQNKRCALTSRNQTEFLNNLNPDQFTFLPSSVISKFKLIIHQYKKVLQPMIQQLPPIMMDEKDSLILDMQKCKTELQLCRCIQSFIRRLFRLTKNYRDHKECLHNLQHLYQRVTRIII